ncbi:MAG: Uncharacterized protein Greene041619_239 [Candidatus Peregrinibacteria bacterium Greene0416_19]|nr:MAG: Uncharacterized protein Greene041619_239 [Candidatus Peregrinibacteria bacterium Greene0416_19]
MDEQAFLRTAKGIRLSPIEADRLTTAVSGYVSVHPVRADGRACQTDTMSREKQFIGSVQTLGMSAGEADRMQENLRAYMRVHPVQATPIRDRILEFLGSFHRLPAYAFSFLLLVAAGGTVTYAAAQALPGDFLYPVKVKVMEPVRVAVTVRSESKARVRAEIAEERLREAEKLVALGRLDDVTGTEIAATYASQMEQVHEEVQSLSEEHPREAAEMGARIEGRAKGHDAVLKMLATERPKEHGQRGTTSVETGGGGAAAIAREIKTATERTMPQDLSPSITDNAATVERAMESAMKSQPTDAGLNAMGHASLRSLAKRLRDVRALLQKLPARSELRRALEAKLAVADKSIADVKAANTVDGKADPAAFLKKARIIIEEVQVILESNASVGTETVKKVLGADVTPSSSSKNSADVTPVREGDHRTEKEAGTPKTFHLPPVDSEVKGNGKVKINTQ